MVELPPGTLPRQTHALPTKERVALGRDLRRRCPRKDHADGQAPAHRRDPIEILIEQGQSRLADLLPLRYARMQAGPFAFLRGAAAVMASDLAATPATGARVQAAGDCHCLNFGGFATPERRLAFDINDFDETAVAPWEWDVKRLATSFAVAARDRLGKTARLELATLVARTYRETLAAIAATPVLDAWYRARTLDTDKAAETAGIAARMRRQVDGTLTHAAAMISISHSGGATPRIQDEPPLVYHPAAAHAAAFHAAVEGLLADYRASLVPERRTLLERYRLADAVYKVVGVGAVGTRCGVLLMVSGEGEALYLQYKEATASVLEAHAGPSPFTHPGERVVRGQRLLQAAGDILLGFAGGPAGRPLYVRQLRDAKIKPRIEAMSSKGLRRYAAACGDVLARAHARTGDAVVLSAYLGRATTFDDAVGAYAMSYARQTELDHASLVEALDDGRLPRMKQE